MQTVANTIFTRYLTYTTAQYFQSRLTGIVSALTSLAQLSCMSITVLYPGVTVMLTGFLDHINSDKHARKL